MLSRWRHDLRGSVMDAPLTAITGGGARFAQLTLDLRGVRFVIERETLVNLPESILLCLFPNGLLLSDMGGDDGESSSTDDEQVYFVDVRCARGEWLTRSSIRSALSTC